MNQDDEFDMDDLDDEFDLDDDVWDDDIEDEPQSHQNTRAQSQQAAPVARPSAGRNAVKKYFYLIVFGILGFLALLFFVGQSGSKQSKPVSSEQAMNDDGSSLPQPDALPPTEKTDAAEEELPMPVPINSYSGSDDGSDLIDDLTDGQEQNALPVAEDNTWQDNAEGGVLTPLPFPGAPVESSAAQGDQIVSQERAQFQQGQFEQEQQIPAPSPTQSGETVTPDNAMNTQQQAMQPVSQAPVQLQEDVMNLKNQVQSLDKSVEGKLLTTDQKIDKLVMMVESLEKRIAEGNAGAETKPAPAVVQPVEEKAEAEIPAREVKELPIAEPAKNPEASVTVPPAEKVVAPKKQTEAKKKTVSWELRSAQPGKAVLARKGSNDLQSVSVGDTLSGIGRIQSIQMEGGKWVVQGSQGRVTH